MPSMQAWAETGMAKSCIVSCWSCRSLQKLHYSRKGASQLAATIYIAAGHGGSDPGAVSGKYIEKALTLKTALACQNYLRNYECETVMA
ncbi:MAG: N-acetylmuramoyl-L-alanine amidase, partial [Acutalibacteraceae bacterium]|nr:N-acetylmuramoyl-L-alanine amidase [Acutalibacteraceae bacterium]